MQMKDSYKSKESVMFYSGNNPCSVDHQRSLSITLYIRVGVWHLCNQQVQKNRDHQKQEHNINDHTQPPVYNVIYTLQC